MRGIDPALVDDVWRETASYPPARVQEEARAFLVRQPHVAAFAEAVMTEREPAVRQAALGLCFLLFKILERSLGRPFPLLAEDRIRLAYAATRQWVAEPGHIAPSEVLRAAVEPGHPTLAAYILSVFYGDGVGPTEYDVQVRASLLLMLRTLTDALDLGQVEA